MKIAIIGAGLAGLSCAHELERYGVSPVIYEEMNFIGDKEAHISACLNLADRPIKKLLQYFKETCHLDIMPLNIIKKLTHYSENEKTVIEKEYLGYFFKRGKDEDSLKWQIYSQLKEPKITFGTKPDFKILSKEYDFVVAANGDPQITKELELWEGLITGWIKGAVVEGDFDPHELIMWIDRRYCKNGYAYLCPKDKNRAALLLFVPYVSHQGIQYYWKQFLDIEKIRYNILEEFAIEHFSGFVTPHKAGNIYLTGNAGGAISPFLGFGQVNSISMGVFAAQSMIEGLDYEKLIKPIIDKEKAAYELRKAYDKLTNKGHDNLLKLISIPGIKHLIYFTNLNIQKHGSEVLKFINLLK